MGPIVTHTRDINGTFASIGRIDFLSYYSFENVVARNGN